MIEITVTKNSVNVQPNYIINRGEYKVNVCNYSFTNEYNGLIKKAVFDDGENKIEEAILNNQCNIPYEVLNSNKIKLRVYAYQVEDDELILRYSPTYALLVTREGSYTESTGSGEVITPTQFEQYEQALHDGLEEVANVDIDAEQTETGATVTITDRTGTEKTVEILNGIDGQDGTNGQDGQDGISIEYNWSGTSLGIKREDEQNYQYVNLKGDKGDAGQIRFIVVQTLPVTDIDVNAIYLVPSQETSTGNIYSEYIYLNGQWEKLGETPIEVDLTDYVKNTDYATDSNAGIVRLGYGFLLNNDHKLYVNTYTYNNYSSQSNATAISKGTLENVLTNRIGSIETALNNLNTEAEAI